MVVQQAVLVLVVLLLLPLFPLPPLLLVPLLRVLPLQLLQPRTAPAAAPARRAAGTSVRSRT